MGTYISYDVMFTSSSPIAGSEYSGSCAQTLSGETVVPVLHVVEWYPHGDVSYTRHCRIAPTSIVAAANRNPVTTRKAVRN